MRTEDMSQGEQLAPKKAYAPPKLTEYGSVAKLTESAFGTTSDHTSIGKQTLSGGQPRR